jgi:hypothetical protein
MAMSLRFLGRGPQQKVWLSAGTHLIGTAAGGALIGLILGSIGQLLPTGLIRAILVLTSAFAVLRSIWGTRSLGFNKQVPRAWGRMRFAWLTHFLWGPLLGAGVSVLIPYSSQLLLWAAEFASGPVTAMVMGFAFGLGRALPAVAPSSKHPSLDIGTLMDRLPAIQAQGRAFNIAISALSVPLVLAIWHVT